MAVVAVLVFVAAYILIATERVPKMVTALVGASIILGLGVASAEEVFYSHETGVDWDVIFRVGRSIWRRSKATHPMGKLREPSEVAEAILFLASDQASFITGEYFPLTGISGQRQRLSCSAAATRCLLPHRRSCLAAPRSARVRYPRSN